MASIRRGYSDDFTLKNNSVGIGYVNPLGSCDQTFVIDMFVVLVRFWLCMKFKCKHNNNVKENLYTIYITFPTIYVL